HFVLVLTIDLHQRLLVEVARIAKLDFDKEDRRRGIEPVLTLEELASVVQRDNARPVRHQDISIRAAQFLPTLLRLFIDKLKAFETQFLAADPARNERADEDR